MNKTNLKKALFLVPMFSLVLFVSKGSFLAKAQTTTASSGVQSADENKSDFQKDVEDGEQALQDNPDAQNNQYEIDDKEDVKAGDDHGDHEALDGENTSDSQIQDDIQTEVEQEDTQGGENSDQGTEGLSSSTASGTDSGE